MFNRILRLKLYQLMWVLTVLLFIVVLIFWKNDNNCNNYDVSLEKNFRQLDETKVHTLNPAIVWWTEGMRAESSTKVCPNNIKCDIFTHDNRHKPANVTAYLFYASTMNFSGLPLPRKPEQIVWGLFHEESPRNVQELMHEKTLNLFNFSSTFSRFSDVPFPLQYIDTLESITNKDYFVDTPTKNSMLNEISSILYLQSDCETGTERDAYVQKLMEYIPIDSYGACLNNKQLPLYMTEDYLNKLYNDEVLRFIARYKFIITIENGVCDDYITEKFWRAIRVGTVPIYFGSPSIRSWLPNRKSAILLEDFPTPKLLSEHIKSLMTDDDVYEEYLQHKTKEIISNDKLINELKERPYQTDNLQIVNMFECFICTKVHMKTKSAVNIVDKSHYNCPKPISALTLRVNPHNSWVSSWELSKNDVDSLYSQIMFRSKSKT